MLVLLGLLSLANLDTTYAIPSSGYGLIKEKTNDSKRQARQVKKVLSKLAKSSENSSAPSKIPFLPFKQDDPSTSKLQGGPRVFIADTNSAEHILDTGTNGFIVRFKEMLKDYSPSKGNIKGVGGRPTIYSGTGMLELKLVLDCGKEISVTVKAVHVPECPYNLISPQLRNVR